MVKYRPFGTRRGLSVAELKAFQCGGTPKTQIGSINGNRQICLGHRGVPGTIPGQKAYMVVCLKCGMQYGANGADVPRRVCPSKDCGRARGKNLPY